MQLEILKGNEIRKTCILYEEIFHDTREYTEYFYEKVCREGTAIVMMEEETCIAELFLLPKLLNCCEELLEAFYIYGVAVKPEYRRLGIMKKLMVEAEEYAKKEGAGFLYLIPEKEVYYQSLGFETIRQGEQILWELSRKEASGMLKFNLEKLHKEAVSQALFEELANLEHQIDEEQSLSLFREREYYREKVARTEADGGEFCLLRKRNDYAVEGVIITGMEDGEKVILDVIGESDRKEVLVKDFMRWEGKPVFKEIIFPIMAKVLKKGEWKIPEQILINDEL